MGGPSSPRPLQRRTWQVAGDTNAAHGTTLGFRPGEARPQRLWNQELACREAPRGSVPGHSRLPTPVSQEGLTLFPPSQWERPGSESWSARRGSRGHPAVGGAVRRPHGWGDASQEEGAVPGTAGDVAFTVTGVTLQHLEYSSGGERARNLGRKQILRVRWEPALPVYSGPFDPYRCCQLHDNRGPEL